MLSAGKGIFSSSNGPPGMACMTTNTKRDTMRKVPTIAAILAVRYRPMAGAPSWKRATNPSDAVRYSPEEMESTGSPSIGQEVLSDAGH